jgi:hypothetical protein
MSFDLSKLTYATQKKTHKIVYLNDELKRVSRRKTSLYMFATVSVLYVLVNFNIYLNSYIPTFGLISYKPESINFLHKLILLAMLISLGYIFYIGSLIARLKSKYDALRLDIMSSIGNGFCTHDYPCDCKDEYIKHMERLGIDMIFK